MPIEIICTCGRKIQARNEDAGKHASCPICGSVVTVPSVTAAPPPVVVSTENHRCSVCEGLFAAGKVYDDRGRIICKNCYANEVQKSEWEQPIARPSGPEIKNHLAEAILCTLFCCLPFGIVAIVQAAQVNGKQAAGDYRGAQEASQKAATWCWLSFGVGLGVILIYFLVLIAGSQRGF